MSDKSRLDGTALSILHDELGEAIGDSASPTWESTNERIRNTLLRQSPQQLINLIHSYDWDTDELEARYGRRLAETASDGGTVNLGEAIRLTAEDAVRRRVHELAQEAEPLTDWPDTDE